MLIECSDFVWGLCIGYHDTDSDEKKTEERKKGKVRRAAMYRQSDNQSGGAR